MNNIENLTPQIGNFEIKDEIIYYDLGSMLRKSSKTFSLLIKDKEHYSTHVGCGACTKSNILQKQDGIEISITYTAIDSKGIVTKTVTETFQDGTKQVIKLTVKII